MLDFGFGREQISGMQRPFLMTLENIRRGPALKARVFLLSLLMLIGTVGVANHVHEPELVDDPASIIDSASGSISDNNLANLVAGDCDQFHINSLAAVDSSPGPNHFNSVAEKGLVGTFSVDSISPELLPPARAPPSGNSLT